MENHHDLYLDIKEFDEKNINYVKPIYFFTISRNMGIYYKNTKIDNSEENTNADTSSESMMKSGSNHTGKTHRKQKIIVKTPKMTVPFVPKEFVHSSGKKSYRMNLSFSTMTNLYNEDEIKRFYYFIKKIDKTNENTIMDYREEWGLPKNIKYRKSLQRLSEDFPFHLNINLPYDQDYGFLFDAYDENAKKASIEIIQKRSIVSAVLELTDLWFTGKEFGANWNLLQIRKFKPYSPIQEFFMTSCFIGDQDDPEDQVYSKIIENYQKKLRTPLIQQLTIPLIDNLAQIYSNGINGINGINGPNAIPIPPPPPPMFLDQSNQSNQSHQSHPKSSTNNINHPSGISRILPPTLGEITEARKMLKKTETVDKSQLLSGRIIEPKEYAFTSSGTSIKSVELDEMEKLNEEATREENKKKKLKKKSKKDKLVAP